MPHRQIITTELQRYQAERRDISIAALEKSVQELQVRITRLEATQKSTARLLSILALAMPVISEIVQFALHGGR